MKKSLGFILFTLLIWNMNAQNKINWLTWEEAILASKKEPKKVFVDVYTDWCGWCKKMDATTFVNPIIVEYMNENFYAIKFNAETRDEIVLGGKTYRTSAPERNRATHELAAELLRDKLTYPSYVFLTSSFNTITPLAGYNTAKDLEPILHFIATNSYKSVKFEDYSTIFSEEQK
jgi:thioredoxin-related protein